jgi:hypothetical protein
MIVPARIVVRLALVSEQQLLEAIEWRASPDNAGARHALLGNMAPARSICRIPLRSET